MHRMPFLLIHSYSFIHFYSFMYAHPRPFTVVRAAALTTHCIPCGAQPTGSHLAHTRSRCCTACHLQAQVYCLLPVSRHAAWQPAIGCCWYAVTVSKYSGEYSTCNMHVHLVNTNNNKRQIEPLISSGNTQKNTMCTYLLNVCIFSSMCACFLNVYIFSQCFAQ